MVYGEEQKREIETITKRPLALRLSDADCKRISEKAGAVGMTVAELLESFIGDLVDGTYTNGSDERMYAEAWFDRCGFAAFPDQTFLHWLIAHDALDEVTGLLGDVQEAKSEIAEGDATPGYWEPGEKEGILEDIACWEKEIQEIWGEYSSAVKQYKSGTFEEEMGKVLAWEEEYKRLLAGVDKSESEG